MKRSYPCLLAIAFLIPYSAVAEKVDPREVPAYLDQLGELEMEIGKAGIQRNSSAMQAYQAAAASERTAVEFYLKCYKELHFTRDEARAAEWRAWEDRNEGRLKDKAYGRALQLQLQYLVLTLQVLEAGDELDPMIPAISRYLDTLSNSLEDLEDHLRVLREPVTGTVFAQIYMLDRSIDLGDWAKSPLDLGSIFGKTIIPFLIEKHPEQVAAAWDTRIRFETSLIALRESPALEQTFATETLPTLLWEKANDEFKAGLEKPAIEHMLTLAKTYPTHPSAPEWLRELRKILEVAVLPSSSSAEAEDPAPINPE